MLKSSKGITMTSLVVMVVSIIILATISISLGYRYIKETKEADEEYFKEVLSNEIVKRENNHTVNSTKYPRIGYHIDSKEAFTAFINEYLPKLSSDSGAMYENGLWYIIDSATAEKLGVKDPNNYIDRYDASTSDKITLAIVNYYSEQVYLFDINGTDLDEIGASSDISEVDDGHIHDYNIPKATCTEDKKCIICGFVLETALGHNFGNDIGYVCIDDEYHYTKECIRCGFKGGYERHIGINEYHFYKSGDGTWYHYNGCSVCGWPGDNKNYQKCKTFWAEKTATEHTLRCEVCNYEETTSHTLQYSVIDEDYHEQTCIDCGYVKIKYEPHVGEDFCEKCGCEIIHGDRPVLLNVKLENKEYPESNYITRGETAKLTFTADRIISDVTVTIAGYGGDNITLAYSSNRQTCTAELLINDSISIPENALITFTINCKSVTTGERMLDNVTSATDSESYLLFDSIPPNAEYIYKEEQKK